jgi:hypothetical protein
MNTYWIVAAIVALMIFIVGEAYAFRHPDRRNTLSRSIYGLGKKWPLSIWIMGVFTGALATHFFWNWCPPGSVSVGFLQLN